MTNLVKYMLRTAVILGLFAIIGTTMVALTFDNTAERIKESEREYLLRSLHALIPPAIHDNDMFTDVLMVDDPNLTGGEDAVPVYRARKGDRNVAAAITAVAPDGYNGSIVLLVAVRVDGTLLGVRAVSHKETPGLGDEIDVAKSDWIHGFDGRSLANPARQKWKVKKDGGEFDQITGATITPRAVVKAVYNALRYYEHAGEKIFAPVPQGKIP
jgi:electron transport complex protein RnfG